MVESFRWLTDTFGSIVSWLFSSSIAPGVSIGSFILVIFIFSMVIEYLLLKASL